jgi:hypothetical protein
MTASAADTQSQMAGVMHYLKTRAGPDLVQQIHAACEAAPQGPGLISGFGVAQCLRKVLPAEATIQQLRVLLAHVARTVMHPEGQWQADDDEAEEAEGCVAIVAVLDCLGIQVGGGSLTQDYIPSRQWSTTL